MKCPNCGIEFSNKETICPNCGIDPTLFEKANLASNSLYNKAINSVNSNDLYNSIEYLNKSIYFNKNNYNARNLLGLIYFEVGQVGEAIKQWNTSRIIKVEDNLANVYINDLKKEPKQIEEFNNYIEIYNQALIYIEQKNDDMAVIQLKKAIEINPKFVDALNLLTFCYLIQNKKKEAEDLIIKVLNIDYNNQTALHYYRELFPDKQRPDAPAPVIINKVEAKTSYSQSGSYTRLTPEDNKKKFGNNFHIAEIISFVIGGICVFVLMKTLINPGIINEKEMKIEELQNTIKKSEKTYKKNILELEEKVGFLQSENSKIHSENNELKKQTSEIEVTEIIQSAFDLNKKGKSEDAAYMLNSVDSENLSPEVKEKYENAKSKVYKEAGRKTYSQAIKLFNQKNYADAKNMFEKSFIYSLSDSPYLADATYYLARIAEINQENELALTYYQTILDKYPNSNRVKIANSKIQELS